MWEPFLRKMHRGLGGHRRFIFTNGDVTNLERGHIRIGISAIMNVRLFTESLNRFHQQFPNVTYEVIEGGERQLNSI